jgi:hypothetical protein
VPLGSDGGFCDYLRDWVTPLREVRQWKRLSTQPVFVIFKLAPAAPM